MPLDYADFVHHYEGHGLGDERARAHFDAVANLLECIVRLFWQDDTGGNDLGIRLDGNTLSPVDEVKSGDTITTQFNDAARQKRAGRKDS